MRILNDSRDRDTPRRLRQTVKSGIRLAHTTCVTKEDMPVPSHPYSRLASVLLLSGAVAMLGRAEASGQVASNSEREAFTAVAVNISNVGRTGATAVDIVIERWTSDAENGRLLAILKEKGPQELLEVLRDTPRVGYFRTPDSLAYDLHYARQIPGEDGGRRIVLATDRPIGFWEATARPRSFDYPFTLIELRMDGEGRGVGKLSIATKITLSGDVMVLENFANQPVHLNDVRKRK